MKGVPEPLPVDPVALRDPGAEWRYPEVSPISNC